MRTVKDLEEIGQALDLKKAQIEINLRRGNQPNKTSSESLAPHRHIFHDIEIKDESGTSVGLSSKLKAVSGPVSQTVKPGDIIEDHRGGIVKYSKVVSVPDKKNPTKPVLVIESISAGQAQAFLKLSRVNRFLINHQTVSYSSNLDDFSQFENQSIKFLIIVLIILILFALITFLVLTTYL